MSELDKRHISIQTAIISFLVMAVTGLAGFWASDVNKKMDKLVTAMEGIVNKIYNVENVNTAQQKDIDKHERSIDRLWELRRSNKSTYLEPAPPPMVAEDPLRANGRAN